MDTVTILLPTKVGELLVAEARKRGVDPATLCSSIVVEHILASLETKPTLVSPPTLTTHVPRDAMSANGFDVGKSFPNLPALSIDLAQQFVNKALEIPGTRAFKTERGIGIEPNFVFVEYLLKRQPGGIGVSFYGRPSAHFIGGLLDGRNPNYSRATAHSPEELKPLLESVRRSYQLKFGRTPPKS